MKIKKLILLVVLCSGLANYLTAQQGIFPTKPWNATVKVVDENGQPVADATVSIFLTLPPLSFPDDNGKYKGKISGTTDVSGQFAATHDDRTGNLGFKIGKTGYYASHYSRTLRDPEENANDRNISITLVLKKIGTPIPMGAKKIDSLKVPEFNKNIGYDLMVGDWVAPYGKGLSVDLFFSETHTNLGSKYILSVTFPNSGDGVQEFDAPLFVQSSPDGMSDLKSLHEAPINGYQPTAFQTESVNLNRNFYFRVRTKMDENGHVVSACYGKIYGDLGQFIYYCNPIPNNRNIEFDPKENLIHGLRPNEGVNAP